jgi:hypothetical protein
MKLTSKKVKEYRTDETFKHCPKATAAACNDLANKFKNEFTSPKIKAIDFMKLLYFNDPIPELHTHSYGFNTATGRAIIETLKMKYYENEK